MTGVIFALAIIAITRMVSLGSVSAGILFAILTIFIKDSYIVQEDYMVFGILLAGLVLFVIAFIYWFGFDMKNLEWLGTYIWTFIPLIFSLIGTGITAFICWGIRDMKKN